MDNKPARKNYRFEIDGIRAFAVIAVIINHFNKDILPSGYLGVDIFFVISGYVITSSLAEKKNKNFWDYISGFYERRVKRLVPALLIYVIIFSILICFFDPNPISSLRTGITSLFGVSNLYLFKASTDYFAHSTQMNVFTQTWSLGVEEQFYIIFPIIVWFTGFGRNTKKADRNLFVSILFLVVFSLISFIYFYARNQSLAYFLMPTRFWEMAIGCLIFLTLKRKLFISKVLEKISPVIVFIGMIVVMFFPQSLATIATISIVTLSALLISCLRKGQFLFNFFTNKKITYIGLISYSLYLWHWGILAISRWTIGIHWWSIPFQLLLIIFFAVCSYKWIETPLRKKDWSTKRLKTIFKGIFAIVFSTIFLIGLDKPLKGKLYLGNKKLNSSTNRPYFQNLSIDKECYDMTFAGEYSHQVVLEKCLAKNRKNKQTLYFLGDSHTYAYWLGAEYLAKETNSNLLTFSYGANLFPSIKRYRINNKNIDLKTYRIMNSFEKEILSNFTKGDVIFINLRWNREFGENWNSLPINKFRFFDKNNKVIIRNSAEDHFQEWLNILIGFTEYLSKKGVSIILSTPTPEFPQIEGKRCKKHSTQWFNKYSTEDCSFEISKDFFISENGKYFNIIQKLNKISTIYDNLYIFDAFNEMCPDAICKYYSNEELLYTDSNHISNYSARNILAPAMLKFLKENKILN